MILLLGSLPNLLESIRTFVGTCRQFRLSVIFTPCITEWFMKVTPWLRRVVALTIRRTWRMREVNEVMTTCLGVCRNIVLRIGRTLSLSGMKFGILVPAELISVRLTFLLLKCVNVPRLATWLLRGSRLTPKLFARTIRLVGAWTVSVTVLGTERPMVMNLMLKGLKCLWCLVAILNAHGAPWRLCNPVLISVRASCDFMTGRLLCSCSKHGSVLTRLLRLRASMIVLMLLSWLVTGLKLGRTRLMLGRDLLGNSIL